MTILNKALLISCSIFFANVLLPSVLIFIAAPLYIYKRIVIFLSKWKVGLYAPLTVGDCYHVADDMYGRPRSSLSGVAYFKGSYPIDEFVKRVKKTMDEQPKAKCIITRWMGVYFWKRCEDFELSDNIYVNEESDPNKVAYFVTDRIDHGYPLGKPLWDIVLLPNYVHVEYGTSSAVALRMHHTLGDGLGIIAVVRDMCDKDPAVDEEMNKVLKGIRKQIIPNFWKKLSLVFNLVFINPSQAMYIWQKALKSQVIPHHAKQNMTRSYVNASLLIDLSFLKRISKKIGANVTSVIHAGVAGAVRRTILNRGGHPTGDITASYALPKLNHPGTLSNNEYCVALITPMSEDDSIKRVAQIAKQLKSISTIPIASTLAFDLVGLLHGASMQTKLISSLFTYSHSNMAFFGEPMKIFGVTMERWVVCTALLRKTNPLFILTITYNGKLHVQLTGDKAVFQDEEDLLRLANYVEDEFKALDGQCYNEMSNLVLTTI